MDWRRFSVDAVAEFMKWEAGLFLSLRPDVPMTTNLDGPLNNWYGYRGANMEEYSEPMDRVGIDIYPGAYTIRDFVPYSTDMVQGVAQGRQAVVLESESFSPDQWKSYDEKQRADFLRSEMWTMIGHGMNGILLWGFDTFSGNDGIFNPRILACRDIAHQTQMINMKDFRRQKSHVALCVDPDSFIHDTGIEKSQNEFTTNLDHENEGFHAALADAGYQTDVIFLSQLHQGVLKNYSALVLPSAMMMDQETATVLKDYVSNGGILIASEPFASMDRWTKPLPVVPGYGLDEVFGCTIGHDHPAKAGQITTAQGKFDGRESTASLTVHGAQVIGTFSDDSPAITSNTFGKGKAIFIARQVGLPYIDYNSPQALSLALADILKQASILPTAKEAKGGGILDVSSLVDSHGNVLVVSSVPTSKGKSLPGIKDAEITYACDDAASFHGGFLLAATSSDGGIVRSGPEPLTLTPGSDNKSISFDLPEIKTVAPVLLAKDAGPLLATEMPDTVTRGQEATVTVTCFNPSSKPLMASIDLRAATTPSVKLTADKAAVEVAPYGQAKVVVKAKVDASAPMARVPLTAFLTLSGQAPEIAGIPVDVEIK
jgi:hypothetical protein